MIHCTLEHMTAAVRGEYRGSEEDYHKQITAVSTDSRKIEPGSLFIPLKGVRVDGHIFIDQVIADGALTVFSEQDLGKKDFPYILVDSTRQALKDLAEFYLSALGIPVVGVTGSVGKTSTKEMIASVLSQRYCTLKTEGNFNNEIGLPLTIFRLREEDEIAVLEMGISDFGEMHRLAKIARPDTCVVTNIGWCHLENLKDRDGILRAKSEIFDFLPKEGHIVLNGDDDKLQTIDRVNGVKPLRFGFDPQADVWADEVKNLGLHGVSCRMHTPAGDFEVTIPMPGRHMVYNALAGTAVGLTYGLTLQEIRRGIEEIESISGRFHIIDTDRFTIIDDCYNANPVSMKASLQVLQDGIGRRIAILGDMGELGEQEKELHAQVGSFAAGLQIEALYCAGPLSKYMAEAVKEDMLDIEVAHFETKQALMEALPALLQEGDTILVKASHFMGFEEIVEQLQSM